MSKTSSRFADLQDKDFDLLIIGGGISGAGIARQAAWSGYSTILCDMQDFAAGTSSRSTKLLHGGIRYLEHFEFGLVKESVRERMAGLELAPHLVKPLPFIFPQYKGDRPGMFKLSLAMWIYDALAAFKSFGRHKKLNKDDIKSLAPLLKLDELKGAYRYYDARTNDARLTLEVILDAKGMGAETLNYCKVTKADYKDNQWYCQLEDSLTQEPLNLRARYLVIAVGPWLENVCRELKLPCQQKLRLTKGIHILVPRERCPLDAAVVMFHPDDQRVMFAIPSDNGTLFGTTDTDESAVASEPEVTEADIHYVLKAAHHYFPEAGLCREDVFSWYAGLRPLLHQEGLDPSQTSREHQILKIGDHAFGLAGGKLTTWRIMADDLMQEIYRHYRPDKIRQNKNDYFKRRFPGSAGLADRDACDRLVADLNKDLSRETRQQLVNIFGAAAETVAADAKPNEHIGSCRLPLASFSYSCKHEMALTLDDLMRRRSSLYFTEVDRGAGCCREIAEHVAPLLGWDRGDIEAQVNAYLEIIKAS